MASTNHKFNTESLDPKNKNIIIDHLAFSCSLSDFQHLERAGDKCSFKWAKLPKNNYSKVKCPELKEQLIADYRAEYQTVIMRRVYDFCNIVLGVRLSNKRDVGLHGYQNSHTILAKTANVKLGFVGVGGNQNTIYFQFSGDGCKHLFEKTTPFILHYWLSKVLCVQTLTRADLAYDDFDGNYTTAHAEIGYNDGAFKNPRGGRLPLFSIIRPRVGHQIQGDTVYIGSRKSCVFWRIYDKALEQQVAGLSWFRNEVELKKINVDVLKNPAKAFAGLCPYAASINLERGTSFSSLTRKSVLDFSGRLKWAKRQVGGTLSDVLDAFNGDIEAAFLAVVDVNKSKWRLTDTCKSLLTTQLIKVQTHA